MKILVFLIILNQCFFNSISAKNALNIIKNEVNDEEWQNFKKEFNKKYKNTDDEIARFKIFQQNLKYITEHNERYKRGEVHFTMKINDFADWREDEFQSLNKCRKPSRLPRLTVAPTPIKSVPEQLDWREKGVVTHVKDQAHCGSCWAFSAVGALEAQLRLKANKKIYLSEQNLVDCSGDYGNNGCGGGEMDAAYLYIKENDGIDTERSYPYEAKDRPCRFMKNHIGANVTGFAYTPSGDENAMKKVVATVGPIAVAIDASGYGFRYYKEGVYYNEDCHVENEDLDHGVVVVGYGTDPVGGDYWIVKNSWGTKFGKNGYILMSRNRNNNCGIATASLYPTI